MNSMQPNTTVHTESQNPRIWHKEDGFFKNPKDALLRYLSQDMKVHVGGRSFPVLNTVGLLDGVQLVGVAVTYNCGTETDPIRVTHDFYAPPSQPVCKEFEGIQPGTIRSLDQTFWVHPLGFDACTGGSVWTGSAWADIVSLSVDETDGKQVVTVVYKAHPENLLLVFDMQ